MMGLGLLSYPTVAHWWNRRGQTQALSSYESIAEAIPTDTSEEMLAEAEAYNERLIPLRRENEMILGSFVTDEQSAEYESLLNMSDTEIMGYIEIPKIDVELPVYHTTQSQYLQVGIGHLEGSSLPVGGKGTHAVLTGHRGLPSAQLFTDLVDLGVGDVFMISIYGRKLTYQVDQILTVLPNELSALAIDPEQDYCTLVTCTPYGYNTHRLLVRGHRIENLTDDEIKTIDISVPEREITLQERFLDSMPVIVVLLGIFWVIVLLMPSKHHDDDDWNDTEDPQDQSVDDNEDANSMDDVEDEPEFYDE